MRYAPIAQLDRVTDYESVGRGFESLSAYQEKQIPLTGICFFYLLWKGLEQSNARVRWTLACRRLDGGNTIIFTAGENVNESLSAYQEIQIPFTGICFFILSGLVSMDTFASACEVFDIKKAPPEAVLFLIISDQTGSETFG